MTGFSDGPRAYGVIGYDHQSDGKMVINTNREAGTPAKRLADKAAAIHRRLKLEQHG